MAYDVGAITASLKLDTSDFDRGAQNAEQFIQQLPTTAGNAQTALGGMAGATKDAGLAASEAAKAHEGFSQQLVRGAEQLRLYQSQGMQVSNFMRQWGEEGFTMAAAFIAAQLALQIAERAVVALVNAIKGGIDAVDQLDQEIIRIAANTQNLQPGTLWAAATANARGYLLAAQQIGAQIGVQGSEVEQLTRAFQQYHVAVDLTTTQGREAFETFTQALKVTHGEADLTSSAIRELGAIISGQRTGGVAGAFTPLASQLKAMDSSLQQDVQLWMQEGTLVQHIADMLPGMKDSLAAQQALLSSQKDTFSFIVTRILQEAFQPAVAGITGGLAGINSLLLDQKGLTQAAAAVVQMIRTDWFVVTGALGVVKQLLVDVNTDLGGLPMGVIKLAAEAIREAVIGWAEGLAMVRAILDPTTKGFGDVLAAGQKVRDQIENISTDLGGKLPAAAAESADKIREDLMGSAQGLKALADTNQITVAQEIAGLREIAATHKATTDQEYIENANLIKQADALQAEQDRKAKEAADKAVADQKRIADATLQAQHEILSAEGETYKERLMAAQEHYQKVLEATKNADLAQQVLLADQQQAMRDELEKSAQLQAKITEQSFTAAGDTLDAQLMRAQVTYHNAVAEVLAAYLAGPQNPDNLRTAMAEDTALEQQYNLARVTAYRNAVDQMTTALKSLQAAHDQTLGQMADLEEQIAGEQAEARGLSRDQILAAQQLVAQREAADTRNSADVQLKAAEQVVQLTNERIALAEKEGTSTATLTALQRQAYAEEAALHIQQLALDQKTADDQAAKFAKAQAALADLKARITSAVRGRGRVRLGDRGPDGPVPRPPGHGPDRGRVGVRAEGRGGEPRRDGHGRRERLRPDLDGRDQDRRDPAVKPRPARSALAVHDRPAAAGPSRCGPDRGIGLLADARRRRDPGGGDRGGGGGVELHDGR